MSALVLTVLISVVWVAVAAVGYLRGGWREVITLAAMLLSYAMLSEWAAPNGADLAGYFGGNVYRSTTAVALLYLIGGTLLLGYFGGSRLPRPIPLSATERFVGLGLGFFNGALLSALILRTLRAYTFGPGDGGVLQEATLSRYLIAFIGYGVALAMVAGIIAPFLSYLLVREPRYTAEYAEDFALAQTPYMPAAPPVASVPGVLLAPDPAASPVFAVPFTPPPAVPYGFAPPRVAAPPGIGDAPPSALPPPGVSVVLPTSAASIAPPASERPHDLHPPLIPTQPTLPPVVPAPMLPTPMLPPAVAKVNDPPQPAPARPPAPLDAPTPSRIPPPGFDITASQPLPVVQLDAPDANVPRVEVIVPFAPVNANVEADAKSVPDTATAPPERSGTQPVLAPTSVADAPDALTAALPVTEEPFPAPPSLATEADDLEAAVELEPEPESTPQDDTAHTSDDAVTADSRPAARARVATVRQPPKPLHMTVPPALQRPVQPGPHMHPCPVCDYPVRNEARFCPNCGTAQPVPAKFGG